MTDIWDDLKTQSLGRALTSEELIFAANLEKIYARNIHDFLLVCEELNKLEGVKTYTPQSLETKLKALNASLDKAYQDNARGAV
jgi:hypothetical protein